MNRTRIAADLILDTEPGKGMDIRANSSDWALDYPYEQPRRSYLQLGRRTMDPPATGFDLSGRSPLLAYGANASPRALARKLASTRPTPLPMLRAALSGFDVVYSAHVSPVGAVPGTLHRSPGTTVSVFVAFPDDEQRRALTATEPNYELVTLRDLQCRLERSGRLGELDAYLSRHRCLLLDGSPVALRGIEARGRRFTALDQAQVRARAPDLPRPY